VIDAGAFHIGPQLQPVRGHAPEESVASSSVAAFHADCVLFGNDRKLIRDDEFFGGVLCVLEDLLKLREPG